MKNSISCDTISDNKYLYIIKCGMYYKIGISNNVNRRLHDVQVSTPFELELIYSHFCKFAKMREYDLHQKFKKQCFRGEWFILNQTNIDWIKQELNKYENNSNE